MVVFSCDNRKASAFKTIAIVLTVSLMLAAEGMAGANNRLGGLNPPEQSWFPKAPPLPRAEGPTVEVSDVQGLILALRQAKPGQTILLSDGHYLMPHYVRIAADNVTLRGASGHRNRVVIDVLVRQREAQ